MPRKPQAGFILEEVFSMSFDRAMGYSQQTPTQGRSPEGTGEGCSGIWKVTTEVLFPGAAEVMAVALVLPLLSFMTLSQSTYLSVPGCQPSLTGL